MAKPRFKQAVDGLRQGSCKRNIVATIDLAHKSKSLVTHVAVAFQGAGFCVGNRATLSIDCCNFERARLPALALAGDR